MRHWVKICCCSAAFSLSASATTSSAQSQSTTGPAQAALPNSPGFLQTTAAPQQLATIFGLITDVNGGVVPGATVSVLGDNGQLVSRATADAGGEFRIEGLAPGRYNLKIEAAGLQAFRPPTLTLAAGQSYKLPETSLPIATSQQSVDVYLTREQIADEEMKEETKQRVIGIMPNFYTSYVWDAAPLNTRQKFKLSLRASTDPWVFIRTAITAGIQQANGTYPDYGSGPSGYAKRYGAAYGDAITGRVIGSAVLPAIFHQDPRYFYRGTGGIPRRTLHALVSAVAARTDRGHIEPNYTHILGDFTAGYISRSWHPGSNNGVTLAIDNTLFGIADTAAHNLAQEFLFKHISRGTPRFAKGKPPQQQESAAHP